MTVLRWLLLHALSGFAQGFFMLVGERVALLGLNYLRDYRSDRSFYGGVPPYRVWPHG